MAGALSLDAVALDRGGLAFGPGMMVKEKD